MDWDLDLGKLKLIQQSASISIFKTQVQNNITKHIMEHPPCQQDKQSPENQCYL